MNSARRQSRILALDLLYSYEVSGDKDPHNTLNKFLSFVDDLDLTPFEYAKILFIYSHENLSTIDEQLISVIDNWSYERVSVIDKCILRIACAEMLMKDVPVNVVIDEFLEISKEYGEVKSSIFVNGVLDKWYKKYL